MTFSKDHWPYIAKIPSLLEPMGIARSDGRRPDGISVMPWKNGRTLVWDATCPDTFAHFHVAHAARESGLVASKAEKAKTQKHALLVSSHHFWPIAIEAHQGHLWPEAITFIKELGRSIRAETGGAMLPAVSDAGHCSGCPAGQAGCSEGCLSPIR